MKFSSQLFTKNASKSKIALESLDDGDGAPVVPDDVTEEVTDEVTDGDESVTTNSDTSGGEVNATPEEETESDRVDGELIDLAGDDIDRVSDEAEEVQGEVNEAADTAVAMESLANVLERSLQTGGLDSSAAALFMGQVQEKFQRMNYPQVGIPAMEDADSPSARVGVASQALATVSKFISDIFKALMDGLAKLGQATKQLFSLITDQRAQLISRSKKLQKILAARGTRHEDILSPRLLAKISIAGNAPKDMLKQLKSTWEVVSYFNSQSSYTKLHDIYLTATKLIDAADKNPEQRADLVVFNDKYASLASDWAKKMSPTQGTENASYVELTSYVAPGNRLFVCRVPKTLAASRELAGMITTTQATTGNSTGAVTPVTVAQGKALLLFVESTLQDLLGNKSNETIRALEKDIKTFSAAVSRLNTQAKVASGSVTKVTRLLSYITTLTSTSVRLPMYPFARGYIGVCSGVLDLVAMSIASSGTPNGTKGTMVVAK